MALAVLVHVQTPEQQKAADQAVQTAKATAGKAARIAALAALAGHYRDIHVSMEAVYTSQPGWTSKESAGHPLLSQGSFPAKPEPPKDMSLCSPAFPVSDVTQLPDNHPSVPQGDDVQLNPRYMDKLTCWLQTQPSHLESSVQLQTGINLFPPQDATYPTYIDFQAAMRLLDQHKSKQRMGKLRSLRRFQDKYQIKTWGHRPGEV